MDTTTAGGRLIFHVFGAVAEFERAIAAERTAAGVATARAAGRHPGRPGLSTDTIAAAHASLPAADRAHAVVVTGNYGEAGAVDRYGPSRGLPHAYSGHTALYALGPPPEDATAVVAVLQGERSLEWITPMFASCRRAGTLDNGVDLSVWRQFDRRIGNALVPFTGITASST